jgi:hypothetical protein
LTVDMMRFIMSGDRPIDGSSSMSSLGRLIIARPMASICCSPPENVPAGCLDRSPEDREQVVGRLQVALISPSLRENAPEQEVLLDRQPGEDPPTLGGVGQTQGDDLVGRDAVRRLPSKVIDPDVGRRDRRWCAASSSCRHRWCR